MDDISNLQKSIEAQIAVQRDLVTAELEKAAQLKRQNDELEKNKLIRIEHNKLLNELIVQMHHVIHIINLWDESNYFDNIYRILEILIPIISTIDSKDETIDILQKVATNIGKRDIHIGEVKGTNVGLGEEINFDDSI